MTKRKAISILETRLNKVDKQVGKPFLYQTGSYIIDFFGEDSLQYRFVSKFDFTIIYNFLTSQEEVEWMIYDRNYQFKTFLIHHKGRSKGRK